MEILIQIRGRVYSLCFGRKTKWFESLDWFNLIENWYHGREVIYAKSIKHYFRQRRQGEMNHIDEKEGEK